MKSKIVVPRLSSRITATLIMGVYIFVSSPVALIAQEIQTNNQSNKSSYIVNDEDVVIDKTEILIHSSEGGTVRLGDASIYIPEGALKEDTIISIVHHTKTEDTGEILYNAIPKSGGYRFLPAGTKFEKEVEITLPYEAELNTKPQVLDDLYTYFYDTEQKQWIKLERLEVDQKKCVVKSLTTHFTDMINATLTLPESASPVDINLNSIKNLEAAKPDSHLIKFNQPKASNFGDGTFSFELGIPAGRRGMQPQISVSYSSGNGNGIMGKGFDINYGSSITTDTRFHLPYYSSDIEKKDTYMLDGIILEELNRSGNTIQYVPQRITSYQTIKRYNAYLENEYWIVIDQNGTKTYFGETALSKSGKSGNVFTWNITRIVDVHGNCISYEYEKDFKNKTSDTESDENELNEYVYPSKIFYTGNEKAKGNYCVEFFYDENMEKREDVRIDGRSKELVRCERLLTSIKTRYKENEPLRIYSFNYRENFAKNKLLDKFSVFNNAGENYCYEFYYEGLIVDDETDKIQYFAAQAPWENPSNLKLNETENNSIGASTNISAGAGFGTKYIDIRDTVGYAASSSSSTGYTKQTLVDIDGDGLIEAIRLKGTYLEVYKQLKIGDGFQEKPYFSQSIFPKGFLLNEEKSNFSSGGWNNYAGSGFYKGIAGVGYTYSNVNQNGSTYSVSGLYDMDGDGFVDIVINPEKYLHNDTGINNGKLGFSERLITGFPKVKEIELEKSEVEQYKKSYAQQRPFRAWKAPYDGSILVKNDSSNVDIYHRNENITTSSLDIARDEYLYALPVLGEDPSFSQVERYIKNNLTIAYSTIKPFANQIKQIVFSLEDDINYINPILSELYNVTGEENLESDEPTEVIYTLKENAKDLLNEDMKKILLSEGRFVPPVMTENQFDSLIKYIQGNCTAVNQEDYYLKFSSGYVYSVTDKKFYVTDKADENYYDTYLNGFINKNNSKDYIENLSIFGISADLSGEKIKYYSESSEDYSEVDRVIEQTYSIGSLHMVSGDKIIELGDINGKRISLNVDKQQISENEYILESINENTIIIKDRNSKYRFIYTLEDCKPAEKITEYEFNNIANNFLSSINDINDLTWNLTIEKNTVKRVLINNLASAHVTDSDLQNEFIDCMYDINIPEYSEEDVIVDETEPFYINKSLQNIERAQEILKEAGYEYVRTNKFKFYNKDYEINPELDINNSYVIEIFTNYNILKYNKISLRIEYNTDSTYSVDGNKIKILKQTDENNNSVVVSENYITYPENRLNFNSIKDFSLTDMVSTAESKLIIYKWGKDDSAEKDENSISIKTIENLYGGKNNWFYGIWTGSDSEHKFDASEFEVSESNLNTNQLPYDKNNIPTEADLQKAGLDKAESSKKITPTDTGKYTYYLPNSDGNKLNGVVSEYYEQTVINDNGTTVVETQNYTSMPIIYADGFRCNRLGGKNYYKIEGVPESLYSSIAVLQKSISKGSDITNGIQGSALGISVSVGSNNSGTGLMVQCLQDVNGDRIPDVLLSENDEKGKKVCLVYYGKLDKNKNVSYDTTPSSLVSDFSYLSESTNSSSANGFSFSLTGAIQIAYNLRGIEKSVAMSDGTSGSFFNGSNYQLKGFTDINGDGIPDYVSSRNVLLGTGSEYVTGFDYEKKCMSEGIVTGNSTNLGAGWSDIIQTAVGNQQAQTLSTGPTFNAAVGLSSSHNMQKGMLLDINGDGLVDYVESDSENNESILYKVYYNTGSKIDSKTEHIIEIPKWDGLGNATVEVNTKNINSSKASVNGTTINAPDTTDVKIDEMEIYCNNLEYSGTFTANFSGSMGLNVNIRIPVFGNLLVTNITSNMGVGINGGTSSSSVSVKMMDLDGDGLADHVLNIFGTGMFWKRNLMGRADLLNKIKLPQGGTVELTYEESYPTYDNPIFKYVMSSVTIKDGCPEVDTNDKSYHSVTIRYNYKYGYYDRDKRDFYGFGLVKTIFADETYQDTLYNNHEYYSKGTVKENALYSKNKELLRKSVTKILPSPNPLPYLEENYEYEKTSGNICVSSSTEYIYENLNITDIKQYKGKDFSPYLISHIDYTDIETLHIYGLPELITVKDSKGNLLRKREGFYNNFGEMSGLRQYWDSVHFTYNSLIYDEYGNIRSVTDNKGATLEYTYDKEEHMFVEKILQYGVNTDKYESFISYDYETQTKTSETDCNDNSMFYIYDSWQRIIEVRTSYDIGTTPAVKYTYGKTANGNWYALTDNKILFDEWDNSVIQTVLMTDGIGRAKWTAKTGCVNGINGWNISGAVEYDNKGRSSKMGMSSFFNGNLDDLLLLDTAMTNLNTSYEYDEKDRPVNTILPDNSKQSAEFYIEDNLLVGVVTDPLGNKTVQKTDFSGNLVAVEKLDKNEKLLTSAVYEYDVMNQMIKAIDSVGNAITVEYDILGRRIALESLDGGRQEFTYDENSNLVAETSSVLREKSEQIHYVYDNLNRLIKIEYPETEDTIYTYGSKSEKDKNAYGKILSITDASGTISYVYGELGEVIQEERSLYVHLNGKKEPEKAVMKYRSDYLGRMQNITYPDGEVVTYEYDHGGQVIAVKGSHYKEDDFIYVNNILYDEYGQRIKIEYGNGTFTEYEYDPARRWLKNVFTKNPYGEVFQNIDYTFDTVGNVTEYTNNCLDSSRGTYKTSQTYKYDDLYQLINVEGNTIYNPSSSISPDFTSNYVQSFVFDSDGLGNMLKKTSKESVSGKKTGGDNLNYDFDYEYDEKYAHRLIRSGNRYYKYDSNGNIICEQDGSFTENADYGRIITKEAENVYSTDYGWGLYAENNVDNTDTKYRRTYTWNERNLLISSVDSRYSTAYIYGQDGQRSNKYTASSETLYFNKMWTVHTDSGISSTGGQSSKNIYLGDVRIVTKLNSYKNPTRQEETAKQYYYHSDHLGSAAMISDYRGYEYQRIEYTPYGELWVEHTTGSDVEFLPYKFTGKEMDEETGLYYYGARYLDPKYSRWLSTDPALGEYIPEIGKGNAKDSGNLPGMGGVYTHINFHLYHYAGNNPIKYVDPDGKLNIPGPNLNFFPRCEDIWQWAHTSLRSDDIYIVAAHGNPNMIYQYLNPETNEDGVTVRGRGTPIEPEELARIIKDDPNYKEGMVIELWACNTAKEGSDGTSYAQKLADAMGEGTVVQAPNTNIWFYRRNQRRLFGKKTINVNGMNIEVEDRNQVGQMIMFIGRLKNEENE